MDITASEIQRSAHAGVCELVDRPDAVRWQVYRELATYSGLSAAMIRQFHEGNRNLTVQSLDKIVLAIEVAKRQRAA
jgi:transcriptional regulator with XRE-family HTH domain